MTYNASAIAEARTKKGEESAGKGSGLIAVAPEVMRLEVWRRWSRETAKITIVVTPEACTHRIASPRLASP